jgi:MFS family permease
LTTVPTDPLDDDAENPNRPWYAGITRYQWLVLIIASAGWAFDAMEGQIYNVTREAMLKDLLPGDVTGQKFWSDALLAVFLLGGTLGGVVFGNLADRYGRKPAMALSILFYSVFSGLTYFATEVWHVAVLRFLVALGVGGEWAVAAALVAEVFPARARAWAGGIFHGTSVVGIWLAAAAGLLVGSEWRYAYLIGVLPALLVLWVRTQIKEPERWQQAKAAQAAAAAKPPADGAAAAASAPTDSGAVAPLAHAAPGASEPPRQLGSFRDLFGDARWARHAIVGLLLAAVGLATFWGVVVAGQDLMRELLVRTGVAPDIASQRAKFATATCRSWACWRRSSRSAPSPSASAAGRRSSCSTSAR